MTEREYQVESFWLWLCSLKKLYRPVRELLLTYFGTPEAVFFAPEKEILGFPGLKDEQKEELLHTRREWEPEKNWRQLKEQGIRFVSSQAAEYPEKLKNIYDYPHGLFVKGKLPDLHIPTVAVVGARNSSAYGRHFAKEIAQELAASGVQVVSGMARGLMEQHRKRFLQRAEAVLQYLAAAWISVTPHSTEICIRC